MTADTIDASWYSEALRRRWYIVAALVLIGVIVGLRVADRRDDTFLAKTKVVVRPITTDSFDPNARTDQLVNPVVEREIAGSPAVVVAASANLPFALTEADAAENLEIRVEENAPVVTFRYTDTDAVRARDITNALADAYLEHRAERARALATTRANELATNVASLTTTLTEANLTVATAEEEADRRTDLESRIARIEEAATIRELAGDPVESTGIASLNELRAELAGLEDTVDPGQLAAAMTAQEVVGGEISNLRGELGQIAGVEIDPGEVVTPAQIPVGSQGTPTGLIVLIAAVVGLLIGVIVALALDRAGGRIFKARELATEVRSPVLATLPRFPGRNATPVVTRLPDHPASQGMMRVANAIMSAYANDELRSFLIASPAAREGRTTIATNIAVAIADTGKRVLLISPDHDQVFAPGVHVLPAGLEMGPPNSYPSTERLEPMLDQARDLVDITILDSPPALRSADAQKVAELADAVLIVGMAGRSSAVGLEDLKLQLQQVGATTLGPVFNDGPPWYARWRSAPEAPVRDFGGPGRAPGPETAADRTDSGDDDSPFAGVMSGQ